MINPLFKKNILLNLSLNNMRNYYIKYRDCNNDVCAIRASYMVEPYISCDMEIQVCHPFYSKLVPFIAGRKSFPHEIDLSRFEFLQSLALCPYAFPKVTRFEKGCRAIHHRRSRLFAFEYTRNDPRKAAYSYPTSPLQIVACLLTR